MKEFKKFMFEKLTTEQKLESAVKKEKNPPTEKAHLLKENFELFKHLVKKGASQETLDALDRKIKRISNVHV